MIICKTPLRVSLFGGGTDFPKWFNKMNGMTITLGIDKCCYIMLRELPRTFPFKYRLRYFKTETPNNISEIKHPSIKAILKRYNFSKDNFEIYHSSDIPGLSGLGSSSAFTVSLLNSIHAWNKIKLSKKELSNKAIYIERDVLKESVGYQDQYACTFGGFNSIEFSKDSVVIKPIKITNYKRNQIIKNSLIVFSGIQRKADPIERDKQKKIDKNKNFLQEIYQISLEAKKILESNSNEIVEEIGFLMRQSWELKKKLSKKVTNIKIDNLYDFGLNNGAIGGKLLGAGGGGYILFLTQNEKNQKKLIKALKNRVHFKLIENTHGSKIIYNNN
jgi:D-glycero-alpha-D-manno-heptose-7-phosphate kinase